MGAPIGNTCPDIDKIVKKLSQAMRDVGRVKDTDEREYLSELLDECLNVMDDAVGKFEDLRQDNDKLRQWGKEMEEEAEGLQVELEELRDKQTQE